VTEDESGDSEDGEDDELPRVRGGEDKGDITVECRLIKELQYGHLISVYYCPVT